MDNFFRHLSPYPRMMPSALRVQGLGYYEAKEYWVDHAFRTFNLSFILRGAGSYRWDGSILPVEAPCVITQWPDRPMQYGPAPGTSWTEFYIIYSTRAYPALEKAGLARPDKPCWQIRDNAATQRQFNRIMGHLQRPADINADWLDRACEMLVVESRLGEQRPPADLEEDAIEFARQFVEEHYLEPLDFDAIAREHGMSQATFRRYWQRHVGTPPARFAMQLRVREARRLLAETRLTVAEIAHKLNFNDPLYFSRRFHAETGITATAYRRRYRIPAPD